MREQVTIDCAGVASADEFWERYLIAVNRTDDPFGRNLDAFWDAIEGMGPGWPGHVTLVFRDAACLDHVPAHRKNKYTIGDVPSLRQALKEIAAEATLVEIVFC